MHELEVTKSILDVVLRHAGKNGVSKVTGVTLLVGELALSALEEVWMQKYFDYLSKNTIAAGAKLHIESAPAVFGCQECGREFSVAVQDIDQACCPDCNGKKLKLISGREYFIKNLEVV